MKQQSPIFHLSVKELNRTGLEQALTDVIDKALIMVVAPSGYGKSMLIRRYFEHQPQLFSIWFPFQREEPDGNWVWKRICNKVQEYHQELYERLKEIGLPGSRQELSYVVRILNEYLTRPLYFVMDDYQECNDTAVNRFLQTVVEEVPMLHIILISRTYPDIPYEELFLKGWCVALNQQNLTLSRQETAQIFELNGISLEDTQLTDLYEYTDGWISAVYLSLYEYQKRGSFGSFLGVNHLLKTAIFDKLTPHMREILMKMSLFDWFHQEGASYVTETEVTESELFENMEQFGFLQYDSNSRCFQMHTLLQMVAETELRKSGIDIDKLYCRAGEWAEKKNAYVTAVRYYKKGSRWERIAAVYAQEHGKTWIEQAPELFEAVKDKIAPYIWEKYIMAQLNYLYYLAFQEDREAVLPIYNLTVEAVEKSENWRKDKNVQGELSIIWSAIQFNDLKKMNLALKEACELLGHTNSALLGKSLLTYGTTCMTVLYYNQSGGLSETVRQEKEYAKYYMYLTRGGQEGWDEFFDAEYALMTGNVEKAYNLAVRVCEQTALRQQTCIVISCYYMMLRCLLYFGKKKEFEQKMQEMKERLKNTVNPLLVIDMELVEGYLYACLGQEEQMPEWLRNFRLENCSRQIRSIRSGCMTYGRLLCVKEDWVQLDLVGDQMIVPYNAAVHIQSIVVGYIYKAIAKYHLGSQERAAAYLQEAVRLAEPDHLLIPFWENAKELEPLIKDKSDCPFLEKVKPYAKQYEKGLAAWKEQKAPAEVRLTAREQELMQYVKQGYKNAQIGEQMHIAQVTVEKNLTSIYRKLGVTNRTAAIRKMEEMVK